LRVQVFRELPRIHRRGADIADLAGLHDIVECIDGFLDWGRGIEAVDLVEIDIIEAEAAQAVVDGVHHMLAREADFVRARAHRAAQLCRNDDVFAVGAEVLQRAAEDFLRDAARIDIGGVEEIDAGLQGLLDEGARFLFFQHPFGPVLG